MRISWRMPCLRKRLRPNGSKEPARVFGNSPNFALAVPCMSSTAILQYREWN